MQTEPAVPEYPAVRPLSLEDRLPLSLMFDRIGPVMSELCFGNLWLFRHAHDYCLSRVGDSLFISGKGYDGTRFFFPPLTGDRRTAVRILLDRGHILQVDSASLPELTGDDPVLVSFLRDDADYLYRREDLAELPGNRYHRKRNRISYFLSRHDARVEPFLPRHREGAFQLLAEWERVRGRDGSVTAPLEMDAAREAIERFDEIGLFGVVVTEGERMLGFALGERLNSRTVVCHFEKGDPFSEGVSQLVNREFARGIPWDCSFINREQDLGDEGLRRAKLSYHPLMLVEKVRVSRS